MVRVAVAMITARLVGLLSRAVGSALRKDRP
jgi:hypothetical protein